ncbi:alpha-2,8-sialyltransferase 8F-like [Pseudochaenichthys georgianus]|uniref:alpha-2,8-sialyltransferase 8F-like n=1 Tax=Pseudochaenichthys georgianus TaxID=52239 RepID=UPI00146C9CD2|nr:alpha-2,8-sialyltransferase 8F-like [Pseudochaenichthys georgianus]
MKLHAQKLSIGLIVLCLGSLLITAFWIIVGNGLLHSYLVQSEPPSPKNIWPSDLCKGCRELIEKVRELYSKTWKKQEDNYRNFSSQLRSECQGFDRAIITQANTPVGSNIVYSAENTTTRMVTPEIFSTFIKENPFPKKRFDTCAVVGNSGILTNSNCGEMIDSAQHVIRCNLPSLGKGYEKHVGNKTDIVTANPRGLIIKYGPLDGPSRQFVESLHIYGKSLLLLPAFAFGFCTPLCLKAAYGIRDLESPIRPTYFNPDYLRRLSKFWRSRGLHRGILSAGLVMVNIALENCANVHVYGFWPFSIHPFELNAVKNHYFDDETVNWGAHSMPAEFNLLLQLHSQGVLRLHLGNCQPGKLVSSQVQRQMRLGI